MKSTKFVYSLRKLRKLSLFFGISRFDAVIFDHGATRKVPSFPVGPSVGQTVDVRVLLYAVSVSGRKKERVLRGGGGGGEGGDESMRGRVIIIKHAGRCVRGMLGIRFACVRVYAQPSVVFVLCLCASIHPFPIGHQREKQEPPKQQQQQPHKQSLDDDHFTPLYPSSSSFPGPS